MIDFDSVLHQVGGFGRYQLFTAIVVGYYGMLVAHYSLVSGFHNFLTSYICRPLASIFRIPL